MKNCVFLLITACITNAAAFTPVPQRPQLFRALQSSSQDSFDPLNLSDNGNVVVMDSIPKAVAASAVAFAFSPLAAMAEEVADDYEYGAVNAPIGLAWGAGVLAILTALLPIALKGGEEAFEEIRQQDESTWGTGNSSKLNRRR